MAPSREAARRFTVIGIATFALLMVTDLATQTFEPRFYLALQDSTVGDLVRIGGLPRTYSEPRADEAETIVRRDEPAPQIVLVGDSYMTGLSNRLVDRPAAQLERLTGRRALDQSLPGTPRLVSARRYLESQRLARGPRPEIVVWGVVQQMVPWDEDRGSLSRWHHFQKYLRDVRDHSLWRMLVSRVLSDLHYPPPPSRLAAAEQGVVRADLEGQGPMLFLADDVRTATLPSEPVVASAAPQMVEIQRAYAELGIRVIVLLIPSKWDVYADLVTTPVPGDTARPTPTQLIDLLDERLRAGGVTTINLRSAFREEARRRQRAQERALFWRDDTHWNELGIGLAMNLVAQATDGVTARLPSRQ